METVPAKNIVTRAKSSEWFGMDYNMNIYRGCCHGCIYCDSRSDCYRIKDFDTVKAKENALTIIRDDLRRKVKRGVIATGAMSDPYNPFERNLLLTRRALELINAYGYGVAIATKSDLVVRDKDILTDIAQNSPTLIKITVTTADDGLASVLEPHAPVSSRRFAAIKELSDAGLFCGILMMPLLPYINDTPENILEIIHRAAESGARFIYPAYGVTLRENQREYYYDRLDQHFPGLKQKYISRYGNNYQCGSPDAKKLIAEFEAECRRLGILFGMRDIIRGYKSGYEQTQLTLF